MILFRRVVLIASAGSGVNDLFVAAVRLVLTTMAEQRASRVHFSGKRDVLRRVF